MGRGVKVIFERITKSDARKLKEWWDAHTPYYHFVEKSQESRGLWRLVRQSDPGSISMNSKHGLSGFMDWWDVPGGAGRAQPVPEYLYTQADVQEYLAEFDKEQLFIPMLRGETWWVEYGLPAGTIVFSHAEDAYEQACDEAEGEDEPVVLEVSVPASWLSPDSDALDALFSTQIGYSEQATWGHLARQNGPGRASLELVQSAVTSRPLPPQVIVKEAWVSATVYLPILAKNVEIVRAYGIADGVPLTMNYGLAAFEAVRMSREAQNEAGDVDPVVLELNVREGLLGHNIEAVRDSMGSGFESIRMPVHPGVQMRVLHVDPDDLPR